MPSEPRDGPYLNMALICERVITDVSGSLGLIDVLEGLKYHPSPDDSGQLLPARVQVKLVIRLVAGGARGKHTIRLRPETPAGMNLPEFAMPVFFEGDRHAVTTIADVPFTAEHEGIYWFDVFLDERRLTRIPLQILYQGVAG